MDSRMRELLRLHYPCPYGDGIYCRECESSFDDKAQWLAHLDTLTAEGEPQPKVFYMQQLPGGMCFAHGRYDGMQCPEWPKCATDPQNPIFLKEGMAKITRPTIHSPVEPVAQQTPCVCSHALSDHVDRGACRFDACKCGKFSPRSDWAWLAEPAVPQTQVIIQVIEEVKYRLAAHDAARQKRFDEWLPIYSAELVRQARLGEAQWWWDNCSTPKAHLEPRLAALAAKPVESEGKK